jgi:hypothetical protein
MRQIGQRKKIREIIETDRKNINSNFYKYIINFGFNFLNSSVNAGNYLGAKPISTLHLFFKKIIVLF